MGQSQHRPDRRALLCGGCASLLSACGPAVLGIPDARHGGKRHNPDTGLSTDTATPPETGLPTPPETTPFEHPLDNPSYPCSQPIEPGAPGWKPFPLDSYPELREVGGWVGGSDGNGLLILVAHVQQDCYVAAARRCTHSQVVMDYSPEQAAFLCPLHGALFGWDGAVLSGPPTVPLDVFFAGRDGETVWVYLPSLVP